MFNKVDSILWLPSWYPSKLDAFNGDFIQRQAKAVSKLSKVAVIYLIKDEYKKITQSVKVETSEVGNLKEVIIYYAIPAYVPAFLKTVYSYFLFQKLFQRQFQEMYGSQLPAVVHVQVAFKAGLLALWIKRKFKIDFLISEHWSGYSKFRTDNYFAAPLVQRVAIKKILRTAKLVIPVSVDLGKQITFIAPSVKINTVPNVVDENFFYYNPSRSTSFKFIHYTSRDSTSKNTMGLLEVLADLKRIRNDWECVIYGPAESALKEFVEKHKLEQYIKFTGEIQYEAVAEIVREASAFVSFSNYENQPCSILEALCCGVPIIATRVGGVPEIVTKQNGILVDAKSKIQLLTALQTMLDVYPNFNRKAIAAEAAARFCSGEIARQLFSVYETL